MRLTILSLVFALVAASAFGAMTTDSPKLSPMLGEYAPAHVTDEGSRKIPIYGVILPDSSGHTGISGSQYIAGQYSSVTGRDSLPQYKLSNGQTVPLIALASISGGNALVPFSASGSVTLAGDVTGSAGTNSVALVGGSTAANVHLAEVAANAATNSNTASTIVKRDASGNFSAGVVSASPQVPVQGVGVTPSCAGGSAGKLALTSLYVLCVCNSSSFVKVSDGSTACTF